jgi:hypothetical protein
MLVIEPTEADERSRVIYYNLARLAGAAKLR